MFLNNSTSNPNSRISLHNPNVQSNLP
uniref:Uncharacterized protein n=1 Tax=Rhizophora mucronata TaxID=61149 RepID=A0A2P2QP45_RHIMU